MDSNKASQHGADDETAPLLPSAPANRNHEADKRTTSKETARRRFKESFTPRSLLVGIILGVIICVSNVYFGLQTGFVNGMSLPSSVLGFAFFRSIERYLKPPFNPFENVLIETVAGAVNCMPMGAALVGVIPALQHLLKPEERGPLHITWPRLLLWSIGVCFFGLFFAMPLREKFIVRETLPFPSATATALVIKTLHGVQDSKARSSSETVLDERDIDDEEDAASAQDGSGSPESSPRRWLSGAGAMLWSFGAAGLLTLVSYFTPILHRVPLFGISISKQWLWNVDVSPGFFGQGIIAGIVISTHMLLGAVVGWGILSPLAKYQGWAPGPVGDWDTGSRGWTVWVSLAAMLADCIVKFCWYAVKFLLQQTRAGWRGTGANFTWRSSYPKSTSHSDLTSGDASPPDAEGYDGHRPCWDSLRRDGKEDDISTLPALISFRLYFAGFVAASILCVVAVKYSFASFMQDYMIIVAILLSSVCSVMSIQAIGETDINPIGAIGKVSQFVFAFIAHKGNPYAVPINIVAGGIAEAGANQAGDLMFDLKVGHLVGASPDALFLGQVIGSLVGAFASVGFYILYSSVYPVPGPLFQVPSAYLWIRTARLVVGTGLPEKAWEFSIATVTIFACTTVIKLVYTDRWWQRLVPSGVAFAVGMYNVPSLSIARFLGGLMTWYWCSYKGRQSNVLMLSAAGLILGEAIFSLVNLLLTATSVPQIRN